MEGPAHLRTCGRTRENEDHDYSPPCHESRISGFPSADHRGPLCFDCEHYNHPLSCHHVALCGRNEVSTYL